MSGGLQILVLATALGCGLMAGAFFAFSAFVMRGLGQLPDHQGIAAMQSINLAAVTPAFMTALFGTGVACLVAGVVALASLHDAWAAYVVAAAVLYLVGAVALTAGYHVPRNDALASVTEGTPEADRRWREYVRSWTAGNHVRAVASLVSSGLLVRALMLG